MILGMKEQIKSDDAADALAVALCAGQSLWAKKKARVTLFFLKSFILENK